MMSTSIAEQKSKTRQRHHAIRRSLQSAEWKQKSELIINRLMLSEAFKSNDTVHTYVSMDSNREVYTIDFIEACFKAGKEVIVPRMKSEGELSHHRITSTDSLIKNKWGVYEPTGKDEVQLPNEFLIIVPMVAADFKCNRLGYGKGYYDRFLSSVKATKIGLCFNCNLCWTPLTVESFDIKMDAIFTDRFVI